MAWVQPVGHRALPLVHLDAHADLVAGDRPSCRGDIAGDAACAVELRSGDVDLIEYVPWQSFDAISADQRLKLDAVDGAFMFLVFNGTKAPFNDPRVRKAVAHAVKLALQQGVDLSQLPRTAVVYDIVYVPLETYLLAAARSRGNRCVDGLGMLLHQAVQRGLLGPVARVVDRGAIAMRPRGLVSVGLHALGMGILGCCSFSGRSGQRIRL